MSALIVVAMMSGCSSYQQSKRTAKAGAGMMIVGLLMFAAGASETSRNAPVTGAVIGLGIGALGAVVGLGGLLGMLGAGGDSAELEGDADPECLKQRGQRLKRAQEIADPDQRAKALLAIPNCEPVAVPLQRAAPPTRRDQREQAFALTKTAARAARLGDCTTAIKIEPQVRELDVMVHDEWFVRDPAINACLAPAPVVPPAGAAGAGIVDPFESPTGDPSRPAPPVTPPGSTP